MSSSSTFVPQKPSNSAVLNLKQTSQETPAANLPRPVSSPDLDTSTVNYNEIFLQEKDGQPEEEKVFFSPLPRSKQLAAAAVRESTTQSNGLIDSERIQLPSSAELQAFVENHDPDTKYPDGYFAQPPLPERKTADEPETDESDAAYISRLHQRDGFFLQPDNVTVNSLVALLRTGCNQIVEIKRKQYQLESSNGSSVPVAANRVVTVNGTHTFVSTDLVPSGAGALEQYLLLHGRSSKYLRCGVYGCTSVEEAQAIRLAAIGIKTDSGGIYVTLSCTADPRLIHGATRRRVVCFAPRAGVVLDQEVDLDPVPAPSKNPTTRDLGHSTGPECCSIS